MKQPAIGIVGVTGSAGEVLPECLSEAQVSVGKLHLYASPNSAGKKVGTPFGTETVQVFNPEIVKETCDLVFLCVDGCFSRKHARDLAEGSIVIDASSAFRMDDDVPLIIPEINGHLLNGSQQLIANMNCTTAIFAMPTYPIAEKYGLESASIITYQAVSGAGKKGLETLEAENHGATPNGTFQHPISGNLIPHIDDFLEDGTTKEEQKVIDETRKIFKERFPNIGIDCTSVRIPIPQAHSEAVTLQTTHPIENLDDIRELWKEFPGVEVKDVPEENIYPMPINATGKPDVEVGRLRRSNLHGKNGIQFFISGDQLWRGTSYNAAEIAKRVIESL